MGSPYFIVMQCMHHWLDGALLLISSNVCGQRHWYWFSEPLIWDIRWELHPRNFALKTRMCEVCVGLHVCEESRDKNKTGIPGVPRVDISCEFLKNDLWSDPHAAVRRLRKPCASGRTPAFRGSPERALLHWDTASRPLPPN